MADTYSCNSFRLLPIQDIESREHVELLYIHMELFNKIFQIWVRSMLPLSLLSASCAILIQLYITIRHTDIPLIVYAVMPTSASITMVIIFIVSYDIVLVMRSAEGTLLQLQSSDSDYLVQQFPNKRVRRGIVKRARAMRPISFPLGNFAEYSLTVPVYVWEEILNQLLFLLSF